MKKIKLYLFSIIFVIVLLLCTNTQAVGKISLSSSNSTIKVGDEFSINVNLSGASIATLTTRVTVDTSKVEYVSGPDNSSFSNGRAIYTWTDPTGGSNPKTGGTIVSFKFRAKSAGKASFSVNGDFYDADEKAVNPTFSGTSVTIEEKQVQPPPTTGGSTGGTVGGNAGGTTGGTTTTNPNTGGSSTTGGSSSGNSSNTGNNQTTSANANLKSLRLDVEGISPVFNKNTRTYYITVPNSVNSINVIAEPEDAQAKVSISGNTNLNVGANKINIVVTAPNNKTTKTYTINVTKTDDPNSSNANLENLAIENVMLQPEFSTDITEYTATVDSSIEKLNILAIPQIEGATVNITGADTLQFGNNTITISVIAKDGVSRKDYILNIYKKTAEEEIALIDTQNLQPIETRETIEKSSVTVGEAIFVAIVCGSILGAIIMFIEKYRKEKNNKV